MAYTQSAEEFAARDESAPHHRILVEFESRDFRSWVKFSQFGDLPEGQAVQAQAGHGELLRLARGVPLVTEKVHGPKSYFPSIEKKYGKPIDYWMSELARSAARRTWSRWPS